MHALKSLALPLAVYLSVALLVPALNGALGEPAFFEHAGEVLLASFCVVVSLAVLAGRLLGVAKSTPSDHESVDSGR